MRIVVCRPQTPFVRGGVEIFTDTLVHQLRVRGHDAEIVALPWVTWPNERLQANALLWRLLDLGPDMQIPADLVITTKFPSYLIKHPNKVIWLVHQFRQAYELHGTDLGQFSESHADQLIRRRIQEVDRTSFGEARRLFATSQNVADRARRSTGFGVDVLPHPPQDLPYHSSTYGDFILCVGRLDRAKRVELLLDAVGIDDRLNAVIVGDGPDRERLESLANGRVIFAGSASPDELADLYATCRAVFYAPIDEDFGMVPFEAFRAARPVVTTADSGGPLEVVVDNQTGRVVDPTPAAIASALAGLLADDEAARLLGENGRAAIAGISWDSAIARLLG